MEKLKYLNARYQDENEGLSLDEVKFVLGKLPKLLEFVITIEKHAGMGTLPDEIEDAFAALHES